MPDPDAPRPAAPLFLFACRMASCPADAATCYARTLVAQLHRHFGHDAVPCYQDHKAFAGHIIAHTTRRPLVWSLPQAASITASERALLNLLAAIEREATEEIEARMAWLFRPHAHHRIKAAGKALTIRYQEAGLTFPRAFTARPMAQGHFPVMRLYA